MSSNDSTGSYTATKALSSAYSAAKNINGHTIMLIIGFICLIIALVGFFSLCGVQTGTCETSGVGSLVVSSTGGSEDGTINPTTEVVAEFLIIMFTVIGVAMLAYVWTITRVTKKLLLDNKYPAAAILINGVKNIDEKDIKTAEMQEMKTISAKLGIPPNALSMSMQYAKDKMNSARKSMNNSKKQGKNSDDEAKEMMPQTGDSDSKPSRSNSKGKTTRKTIRGTTAPPDSGSNSDSDNDSDSGSNSDSDSTQPKNQPKKENQVPETKTKKQRN